MSPELATALEIIREEAVDRRDRSTINRLMAYQWDIAEAMDELANEIEERFQTSQLETVAPDKPPTSERPMTELELATTDDLINELMGRFEHAVFGGLKCPTDEQYRIARRWKGNSLTCAGLGHEVAYAVLLNLDVTSTPDRGE